MTAMAARARDEVKKWGINYKIKLENIIFWNSGFPGDFLTFPQWIICREFGKNLLMYTPNHLERGSCGNYLSKTKWQVFCCILFCIFLMKIKNKTINSVFWGIFCENKSKKIIENQNNYAFNIQKLEKYEFPLPLFVLITVYWISTFNLLRKRNGTLGTRIFFPSLISPFWNSWYVWIRS